MRKEPTTIGLGDAAHARLHSLKEAGYFNEMADGYRLAIAVALAHGSIAVDTPGKKTIFNVGTLDSDRHIYTAVQALWDSPNEPVYAVAERLAEWGVEELSRRLLDRGESIVSLLQEASDLADQ